MFILTTIPLRNNRRYRATPTPPANPQDTYHYTSTTTAPHRLRRTGRGYHGSTRQRLRFSDTTTWLLHPMRGIWSEETIFIQSLRQLIPNATPQLHRKRSTATTASRRRLHRIRIHKEPTRRSRRPSKHLSQHITRFIRSITRLVHEALKHLMPTPPAPTQSHSTTSRTGTYTHVHNKRLIISTNPQAHSGRILGGMVTPPYSDSLWPYYVLHLNKWCQDNDDKTGHTQKTPSRQEFEAKTTSQQYQEFAKI
jgi:hypothetical protein